MNSRRRQMRNLHAVPLLVLIGSLLLAGCGQAAASDDAAGSGGTGTSQATSPSSTDASPESNPPPLDWQNPLGGTKAGSVSDAQSDVPFTVFRPEGLGAENAIRVSVAPDDPKVGAVVFTYSGPPYGLMYVEEATPQLTAAQWDESNRALVASIGDPGVHGSAKIVTIRNGIQALITTSADGTQSDIRWLEKGYEMTVRGQTLSAADCVAIAEGIGGVPTS